MNSGIADQMPMTLCQLKSRALPVPRPLEERDGRHAAAHVQTRGSQRYMPETTRNRKSRFDQPVMARAVARDGPRLHRQPAVPAAHRGHEPANAAGVWRPQHLTAVGVQIQLVAAGADAGRRIGGRAQRDAGRLHAGPLPGGGLDQL